MTELKEEFVNFVPKMNHKGPIPQKILIGNVYLYDDHITEKDSIKNMIVGLQRLRHYNIDPIYNEVSLILFPINVMMIIIKFDAYIIDKTKKTA